MRVHNTSRMLARATLLDRRAHTPRVFQIEQQTLSVDSFRPKPIVQKISLFIDDTDSDENNLLAQECHGELMPYLDMFIQTLHENDTVSTDTTTERGGGSVGDACL